MATDWAVIAVQVVSPGVRRPLYTYYPQYAPTTSGNQAFDAAIPPSLLGDESTLPWLLFCVNDIADERVGQRVAGANLPASNNKKPPNRSASPSRIGNDDVMADGMFLDMLLQSHDYVIYGMESFSRIRVFVVCRGEPPREHMKSLCSSIYVKVSAAVCNPFRSDPLQDLSSSPSFVAGIKKSVDPHIDRSATGNIAVL